MNGFQTADQVKHVTPRIGTTGGGAEMRAAAKRAIFVDATSSRSWVQQRTRAIGGGGGQTFPARGSHGAGGDHGFAFGQHRHPARDPELTATGALHTAPFRCTASQIAVNGLYRLQGGGGAVGR